MIAERQQTGQGQLYIIILHGLQLYDINLEPAGSGRRHLMVYTSLDQESTENPFEGGANDVPISQMSRTVEIDMREMLGEVDLPPVLQPQNNIVL